MVAEQFLAGVLVVFAALLVFVQQLRTKQAHRRLPPGPTSFPIIGSSHIVAKYRNAWDAFTELRRRYGDVYAISLGSRRCLVVSSVEALREVLVTKASDFADRPDSLRYHAIFKDDRNLSIALCDWSSKQRIRRELCYPPMHPKHGSTEQSRLSASIENELAYLAAEFSRSRGTALKPRQPLLVATANIFYTFLCSERFSPDDPKFLHIVDLYNEVFHQLFQGFAIDFMPWLKVLQSTQLGILRAKSTEIYHFTEDIMARREKALAAQSEPLNLTDMLLLTLKDPATQRPLSRVEVAVVVEDLIGGHSVIANLWLWCLYILSSYPEVQDQIRAEAHKVLSSRNGTGLALSDKPRLSFTEATLYEIIRVVNSPIIPHVCTKDTTVQSFHVSRGTVVMFNTNDINYSADLWQRPWDFKPERFLGEDGSVLKPGHFFPFGTGRRSCMGDGLVRAILVLGLASLVMRFELSLGPAQEPAHFASFRCKVIFDQDPEIIFTDIATQRSA